MTRKRNDGSITREQATPEQIRCWNCLSSVFGGDHHLGPVKPCANGIEITTMRELATFDDGSRRRTGMVAELCIAAHLYAVRIGVEGVSRHKLKITAFPRKHDAAGQQWERHPSLAELSAKCVEINGGDA